MMHDSFKQHRLLLVFYCILLSGILHAQQSPQDYRRYYKLVNRAEEIFVMNGNSEIAMQTYDSAFREYPRPFIHDLFKAAEIAYSANRTAAFLRYTKAAFDRGMPVSCITHAQIFSTISNDSLLIQELQQQYYNRLLPAINPELHDSIYMHFYRAQLLKRDMGRDTVKIRHMHEIEKQNIQWYNDFVSSGYFPNEQLIGLYTEQDLDIFLTRYNLELLSPQLPPGITNEDLIPEDYDLTNKTALVSYMHYPCLFQQSKNKLFKTVLNGYLHPNDYAMLEEWTAKSKDNPIYPHDCVEETKPVYYNVLFEMRVNDPKTLVKVEENRKKLYMQKYAVDVQKRKLEKEKGFVFFFGYMHNR